MTRAAAALVVVLLLAACEGPAEQLAPPADFDWCATLPVDVGAGAAAVPDGCTVRASGTDETETIACGRCVAVEADRCELAGEAPAVKWLAVVCNGRSR